MVNLVQKKGDLTDIILFVIGAFIFGVIMFTLIYIVPQIGEGLNTAGLNNTPEMRSAIGSISTFTSIINYGTFFVFVGLLISIMITSFLVRSHPVFLIMYLFFIPISIILAVYLGNAYNTLATNAIFISTYGQASLINLFFANLVKITLVANFLSLIIVFAKFGSAGGQNQY
jgi:hypothetical protein